MDKLARLSLSDSHSDHEEGSPSEPSSSSSSESLTSEAYESIDLDNYSNTKSIAHVLVTPQNGLFTPIMTGVRHVDYAIVAALALNEACRNLKRGFFHYAPPTEDIRFGHVCDLIFSDQTWSTDDTSLWDNASWMERLSLCDAIPYLKNPPAQPEQEAKQELDNSQSPPTQPHPSPSPPTHLHPLTPTTPTLPIITRFLLPLPHATAATSTLDSNIILYHPTTGPPGSPNALQYTRSQADVSSWLLLFDAGSLGRGAAPFSVRTQALEHRAHCAVRTSRDLRYETFRPYRDPRVWAEPLGSFFLRRGDGRKRVGERLRESAYLYRRQWQAGGMEERGRGLRKVVEQLIREAEKDERGELGDPVEAWGRLRWGWANLKGRIRENERRGWGVFFGKKLKRRRRDRERDALDDRALGL